MISSSALQKTLLAVSLLSVVCAGCQKKEPPKPNVTAVSSDTKTK